MTLTQDGRSLTTIGMERRNCRAHSNKGLWEQWSLDTLVQSQITIATKAGSLSRSQSWTSLKLDL